jgi:hypothetical protein
MNNDAGKSFWGKSSASGRCGTGSPDKIPKWNDYYESLKCELMRINAKIMP